MVGRCGTTDRENNSAISRADYGFECGFNPYHDDGETALLPEITDFNSLKSPQTFSGAIYCLAAEPDKYIPVLRAELLEHMIDGQITKDTLPKLVKMDSFLRESGRFNNAGLRE